MCAQAWGLTARDWAHGRPLPWLHGEVARRMGQRLSFIRMQPEVILDWEALAGQSRAVLQAAYPHARWVPAAATSAGLMRPQLPSRTYSQTPTTATRSLSARLGALGRRLLGPSTLPPASGTPVGPGVPVQPAPPAHGQLLWSNLGLHAVPHPRHLLQRWHAALAVDGFLMFSTFGPDTLREWRALWKEAGWGPPAQPFRDLHDWGDDLVAAGFADPVMDQEILTLTWASAEAALAEMRTLGRNAHPNRHPGCRTPAWKSRMRAELQRLAGPDGRLALSFEIIYGHAFRPPARPRVDAVATVSLNDMRHMVQTARRPR